jgi:hypothetical protein
MAVEMISKFGRDNLDFIYMDTGAEHPKTYEFIKFCDLYFDLNLTCLQGDFNQPLGEGHTYKIIPVEDLKYDLKVYGELVKKYGMPGIGNGWCTSRMKEDVHDKYCNDTYGEHNYETWLGMRSDEPLRIWGNPKKSKHSIVKIMKNMGMDDIDIIDKWRQMGDTLITVENVSKLVEGNVYLARLMIQRYYKVTIDRNIHYMAEITDMDKSDVMEHWSKMPFDLEIPEWCGNCVYCFKKSDLKLAAAAKDEPEMYQDWLQLVNNATVRDTHDNHRGYRKKRSIGQVIATFDGSTGEEIKARIRGGHMVETNSCSESCEAFGDLS